MAPARIRRARRRRVRARRALAGIERLRARAGRSFPRRSEPRAFVRRSAARRDHPVEPARTGEPRRLRRESARPRGARVGNRGACTCARPGIEPGRRVRRNAACRHGGDLSAAARIFERDKSCCLRAAGPRRSRARRGDAVSAVHCYSLLRFRACRIPFRRGFATGLGFATFLFRSGISAVECSGIRRSVCNGCRLRRARRCRGLSRDRFRRYAWPKLLRWRAGHYGSERRRSHSGRVSGVRRIREIERCSKGAGGHLAAAVCE